MSAGTKKNNLAGSILIQSFAFGLCPFLLTYKQCRNVQL